MTGILEQISAQLTTVSQQLSQVLAAGGAAPAVQQIPQQLQAQPTTLGFGVAGQQGAGAPLGGAAAPVGYPPATAEMITALITPHVQNPAIHAALKEQMAAMNIASLPDAQPGQYPELHARFQSVITQAQAAAAAQPQAAAQPASII
jgi:hypothetical protein